MTPQLGQQIVQGVDTVMVLLRFLLAAGLCVGVGALAVIVFRGMFIGPP
jgi:hypothetical protein